MLNTSPDPLSAAIAVPAQPPGITLFRAYTSSATNYWQSSTVPVTGGKAAVGVPGYGVVTLYGVAPPLLSARLSGPERLALSWGHAAVGFVLQSASSLTPTPGWANDTNTCVVADATATVTVAAAGKPRFYRLVLP
jgi:hypothetical protein